MPRIRFLISLLGALFLSAACPTHLLAATAAPGGDGGAAGTEVVAVSPAGAVAQPIVARLVELGMPRADAEMAAASLTAQDIEILLANPEMMQRAAGTSLSDHDLLLVVVIALLVALIVVVAVD
jgi:hypothetical protein